jgi:hypothetical protein
VVSVARGKARKSIELIEACTEILEEIQPATVRALCYRLFTRGLIASMAKSETNRVSVQVTWAREQGIIPWSAIVDETREVEQLPSWDDPDQFFRSVIPQYRRDRWALQPLRVECWSEKGTVRGTLKPILDAYGVAFRVLHGYGSATAVQPRVFLLAAREFQALRVTGVRCIESFLSMPCADLIEADRTAFPPRPSMAVDADCIRFLVRGTLWHPSRRPGGVVARTTFPPGIRLAVAYALPECPILRPTARAWRRRCLGR